MYAEKVVSESRGLVLAKSYANHLELFGSLRDGYRSDVYIIDCLLRGQARNYGYEIIRELRELQPDALIVVSSQIETMPIRRDLSQYKIQSVLDKTQDDKDGDDWGSLLTKTLVALSKGLRSNNPAIDVYELIDVAPVDHSRIDRLKLSSVLKESLRALFVTWHVQDAALMVGCSLPTYRHRLIALCNVFQVSSANPLHSLWTIGLKRAYWKADVYLKQRGIEVDRIESLSDQERALLISLSEGHSKETIADELCISSGTVYGRLRLVKDKTGAETPVDLWTLGSLCK